jgi:hypothetical protein
VLVELETELSDRERYEASLIRLKAVPLNQDVEQGHSETYFGFEVIPDFMPGTLEVADISQRREHGLDQHTDIPLATLTQAQVGGMPVDLLESGVRKDDYVVSHLIYQTLESAAILDVSRVTGPTEDEATVIDQVTQLAAHDPAMVGFNLFADLLRAASLPNRMQPRGTRRTATRCHSFRSRRSLMDRLESNQCSPGAS